MLSNTLWAGGEENLNHYLVSPLNHDLSDLAPVIISCGGKITYDRNTYLRIFIHNISSMLVIYPTPY